MKNDQCQMINKSVTRILGIDPGTGIMGWGLIAKSGSQIMPIKYGCIQTPPNTEKTERLLHIFNSLSDIIEKNHPDEVCIEELFFFKNQKTIISVAEARGVAVVVAKKAGLPVFEYTPLQIKQALTGYGRAEKSQVQEMVKISCKLKECPKPDDAADALAIAICHAQTSQILS
jgi:crossover junction endodeoxyribonuclease RuvC